MQARNEITKIKREAQFNQSQNYVLRYEIM